MAYELGISDWSSDVCSSDLGGEVSARARAAELGRSYLALNATGRHRFLSLLAEEFGPDREQVAAAVEALGKADGEEARRGAERGLRTRSEERRVGKGGVSTCSSRWSPGY